LFKGTKLARPLIVHILYQFDIGGLETVLVNMLNTMSKDHFKHIIISLTDASDFTQRIKNQDVEIKCLFKKPGKDPIIHFKIWKILRELSPEIVHTYNISALEYSVPAMMAGVPCRVHAEHGRDIYDLDGSNQKYQYLRKIINPIISKWIPVSKELENWLINVIGIKKQKVKRIYNGIDTVVFSPQKKRLNKKLFTIGTVGRLAAVKDQVTLIKAVEILIQDFSELKHSICLKIVGDGPLFNDLDAYIRKNSLEDYVELLGAKDNVEELMQSFDVFVLPSLVEGIALTMLEAMATGLPVIATNVGGNPELISEGENGFLVQSQQPRLLAKMIKRYIDIPDLIERHGQNGRSLVVQKFSLKAMTQEYLVLYQDVMIGK
jgi:sugar transferase (PEP-CTERM/EpsH1 system associated)